jgi:hypothetical protein
MSDDKLTVWQRLSKGFGPNSLLGQEAPTLKFDKNILLKTPNKDEYERELLQARQTAFLANQWSKIEHNLYTQSVYYEPTRLASYYDFEGMEQTPEISAALDTFAEESTTPDQNGLMMQIYSESKRIKSILTDLFYDKLDVNTNLPMWTRNVCKYGDNFVFLKLDPEKGVVGCFQLPNIEIERIEKGMINRPGSMGGMSANDPNPKQMKFHWKNKQLEFNTWEIAHFRLLGDDRKLPYGTCLKYDTRIDTELGVKEIKDIKIGDKVWSFDIKTQQRVLSDVLDVVNSGSKINYGVYTKHNFIECSEEHKIMVFDGIDFIYKNTLELKIGDLLVINNDTIHLLEPIIKIIETGEFETHDIYVSNENHNFYANGIVVHNSILEKARRIWRLLVLAEDAMLVYRTSRAPERRVFKVFVGNMDDKDVEAYVNRFANKFKRDQVSDQKTGNVDLRYNQMAVDQDYFVPVRDLAAPTPIDTLPGACISLETKIPLLDGRTLPLQEIINEWDNGNRNLWVYSCDPITGSIHPGIVTWAGITRQNAEVLKITLDNGEEIITTPDHKFVHRTNGFVEAQNLIVGDSLMPFYQKTEKIRSNTNDYHQIFDNEKGEWIFTHRMVRNSNAGLSIVKEWVFDEKYQNREKNVIHHKDHNRFNNLPDNLLIMYGGDHMRYHQSVIKETVWGSPELNKKKISIGLTRHINNLTSEEKKSRFLKNINSPEARQKTTTKLLTWNKNEENLKVKGRKISEAYTDDRKERIRNINIEKWKDDNHRKKVFAKEQKIKFDDYIYNSFLTEFEKSLRADITLRNLNNSSIFLNHFREINNEIRSSMTNLKEFTHNHIDKMVKERGFKNFREWKKNECKKRGYINLRQWKYIIDKIAHYNHKIVKIEWLEQRIDTGTITVDGNETYSKSHTFAIASGIFIKNSNLGEIQDIEYIQKKLLTALRIPKAFLGFEEVVADGKNLALQDIRFARTINRVQKSMLAELNKIAIIHLFLLGFEDELSNFTLGLTNPSTQADLLKVDVWKEKVLLYRDAVTAIEGIAPTSHSWAKKHVLGFSDEEIKLDIQQQRIERAVAKELENTSTIIVKTGIFDSIDSIYGQKGGEAPQPQQTEGPNSDMELPDMSSGPSLGGGGDMDIPAPETTTPEVAPPTETPAPPETVPETVDEKMNILLEGGMLKEDEEIDLGKARTQLGIMQKELDKLINS